MTTLRTLRIRLARINDQMYRARAACARLGMRRIGRTGQYVDRLFDISLRLEDRIVLETLKSRGF